MLLPIHPSPASRPLSLLLFAVLWASSCCLSVAAQQGEGDYYDILGLGAEREDATDKDIKRQFRLLSKKYHPDVNPSEEAKVMFTKVNQAYEVLSDRKKRKMYDIGGEQGLTQLQQSSQQQNQGNDIFSLFGFGGGGGGGRGNKGQNAQMSVEIPLQDFYNGHTHQLSISKQKLCKRCKGSGAASGSDYVKCSSCNGQGSVVQRIQLAPGFVQQVQQTCPHCNGKGKMIKHKCPQCKGQRVVRGESTLELVIEQGMHAGQDVVFEMEADQNPDVIPGDVVITLKEQPHPVFRRRDVLHLETKITINVKEALLGFSRDIVHMDGHVVRVTRSDVTPFGTVITVRGEGMPRHHVPSEKGDLLVTVEFELPHMLTDAQKAAIEEAFGDTNAAEEL